MKNFSEQQQPMERPKDERSPELRPDLLSEDIIRIVSDRIDELQKKTDSTALTQIQKIVAIAQRDIDAIKSSPGVSKQFVREYLDRMNDTLHGRALHVSMLNENVIVTPHHPKQFSPEIAIRRERMNQIKEQIKQVCLRIAGLSSRRRRRPMFNRPNTAQPNIAQLFALKFQLEQQLDVVKNTRISEPIPLENPVLTFDPNCPPDQIRQVAYTPTRSPSPQPEQIPLGQEVPKASVQQDILHWSKRWKESKTKKEDRDMAEGFLMMNGVDIDSSDLTADKIVMMKPEERAGQAVAGLMKILTSFLGRIGWKKTNVKTGALSEKDPSVMTPDEKGDEIRDNAKKMKELKDQKMTTEKEITTLDKKLSETQEPGEAKTKLEEELKQKKDAVKKIDLEIKKLWDRNNAISQSPRKDDEKDIVKQDKLQDDPMLKKFQSDKEAMKLEMRKELRAYMPEGMAMGVSIIEGLRSVYGKNNADPIKVTKEEMEKGMNEMMMFFDACIDGFNIEKNSAGLYRITIDTTKAQGTKFLGEYSARTDITQGLAKTFSDLGLEVQVSGNTIVTPFMKEDELMKNVVMPSRMLKNTQKTQKDSAKNEPETIKTPAPKTPDIFEEIPTLSPTKLNEMLDRAKTKKEASEGLETALGNLAMQIGVRSIANFNRTENVKVREVLPKILAAVKSIAPTEEQKVVLKTLSIAIVPNRSSGEPVNQNIIELTTDQSGDEIVAIMTRAIEKKMK